MQALILAGGQGTRLRPLTESIPKPVLPLAGRPHIAYVIDWLEAHGVDDVVISCGFLAEAVRDALDGITGPRVRFATEPEPRGTAGAIRFAADELGDRFLVLNGDVLCDLDLTAMVAQHESTGARATIALYPGRGPDRLRPRPSHARTGRSPSSSRSPTPPRSTPTRSTRAPTSSSARCST